jgi:hypothetical protein
MAALVEGKVGDFNVAFPIALAGEHVLPDEAWDGSGLALSG